MTKKPPLSKVDELREALKTKKEVQEKNAESLSSGDKQTDRDEEKILSELHAAEKESKEHYEKLLRLMAEFENFKKRTSKEHEEHVKFANEKLMKELLPILDDFDRVLDHIGEEKKSDAKAIVDGVALIRKSFLNALNKFGLSEIEALDKPFDPKLHEAVSVIADNDKEDNTVMAVHRKGYKLADRVIRAAQVIVSKRND